MLWQRLDRRRELSQESWSSPSSALKDLGAVEILWCDAVREDFLQACREKYCEACAIFILEVMEQRRKEESVRAREFGKWLDRVERWVMR